MATNPVCDGWKTIKNSGHSPHGLGKKARRKRRKQGRQTVIPIVQGIHSGTLSVDKLQKNTTREIDEMSKSVFFQRFMECFESTVLSNCSSASPGCEHRVNIICYGLGSFSTSRSAMHQLAFLCAVAGHLRSSKDGDLLQLSRLELFEPILSEIEETVLDSLGIDVLSSDSNGHYVMDCTPKVITFCFMPHCPRILYNNLLSANWTQRRSFDRLFIFGNSLSEYDGLSIGSNGQDPVHGEWQWIRKVIELDIVRETAIEQWIEEMVRSTKDSVQRERASIARNAFAFQKLMHFTTASARTLKVRVTLFLHPDWKHIPNANILRKPHRKSKYDKTHYKEYRYFLAESRIDVFDVEWDRNWDSITFIPCTASKGAHGLQSLQNIKSAVIPIFLKMRSATTSSMEKRKGSILDIDTVALHYVARYVFEHRLRVSGLRQIEDVMPCDIGWDVRSQINDESLIEYRSPVQHETMRKIFGNAMPQRLVRLVVEYLGVHRFDVLTVDGEVTMKRRSESDWTQIAEVDADGMDRIAGINVEESSVQRDNGQTVRHLINVPMRLDQMTLPCSLQRHSPFNNSIRNRWNTVKLGKLSPLNTVFRCRGLD